MGPVIPGSRHSTLNLTLNLPASAPVGLGLPHMGPLFCVLEMPGTAGGLLCYSRYRGVSTRPLSACRSDCIALTLELTASFLCSLAAWVSCFWPPWVALPDPVLA